MTAQTAKSDELVEIQEEMPLSEAKAEDILKVSKMPRTDSLKKEQWLKFGEKTSSLISDVQNSVGEFFNQYQSLLGTLGWILLALITVKLTVALLNALNDIPFVSLLLELIGLGYVIWFIYRYLLSAQSRQELSGEIQNFKKQFFDVEG